MTAVLLTPLLLVVGLGIWAGSHSGPETGFVVGLLAFVFLGGMESTGFGLFALWKKWVEADKKKAQAFDRKRKESQTENETP